MLMYKKGKEILVDVVQVKSLEKIGWSKDPVKEVKEVKIEKEVKEVKIEKVAPATTSTQKSAGTSKSATTSTMATKK